MDQSDDEDSEDEHEVCIQLEHTARPDDCNNSEELPEQSIMCSIRRRKTGLLIFSALYIPLFAGAFFGFGPMQLILEESGAFASLCDTQRGENITVDMHAGSNGDDAISGASDDAICPEQTARLLTV